MDTFDTVDKYDIGYALAGASEPTTIVGGLQRHASSYIWDTHGWAPGAYEFYIRTYVNGLPSPWTKSAPVNVPCGTLLPCQEPAALRLKYRARMYAPKAVDPTEATLLTPVPGSIHTDPFTVTSVEQYSPHVGEYKPYLSFPEGKNAAIDAKTRHTDYGDLTLTLVDHRVTDNSGRWLSAFLGDAVGRGRMRGCRVEVDESFDGGQTWHPYYEGRVMKVDVPYATTDGPAYNMVLREQRVMEYRNVFIGLPHKNVWDYARPSPLWPIGVTGLGYVAKRPPLANDYLSPSDTWSWNGYALRKSMLGECRETTDSKTRLIWFSTTQFDKLDAPSLVPQGRTRACTALFESCDLRDDDSDMALLAGGEICPHARVRVRWRVNQFGSFYDVQEGHYWLTPVVWKNGQDSKALGYDGELSSPLYIYKEDYEAAGYKVGGMVAGFGLRQLSTDPEHPLYAPLPPVGAVIDGALVYRGGPPTEMAPIMIDRVHPARLWEDLNKGYFSELDENGNVATSPIPYQEEEFVAMKSDGTLPKLRLLVTGQENQAEFLTDKVFSSAHIAARTNPNGKVGVVDLRLPSLEKIQTLPVITDHDMRDVVWSVYDDIITNLVVKVNLYYGYASSGYGDVALEIKTPKAGSDRSLDIPVDVPACGILTKDMGISFLSEAAIDLPLQSHTVNAAGICPMGYGLSEPELDQYLWTGENRVERKLLEPIANEYLSRFGHGAMYLTCKARRMCFESSSLFGNYGVQPGQWVKVASQHTPNLKDNKRGGVRLMQVLSRQDTPGEGLIELKLIDAGPQTMAEPPILSNLRINPDKPSTGVLIDVDLVNDGVGETVVIETAMTDTITNVIPDQHSLLWTRRGTLTVDTVGFPVDGHNAGKRVWLRARTAGRYGEQLGSDWVYAEGHVDLGLIPNHFSVVVNEIEIDDHGTSFDPRQFYYYVSANCGDAALISELYVYPGRTAPARWLREYFVTDILPGETLRYDLFAGVEQDQGPTQTYWIAVRHRTPQGSVSDFVQTFYVNKCELEYKA